MSRLLFAGAALIAVNAHVAFGQEDVKGRTLAGQVLSTNTVRIMVTDPGRTDVGLGFIVGEGDDGTGGKTLSIVTAGHVVLGADSIDVTFCRDQGALPRKVLRKREWNDPDLAVLTILMPDGFTWQRSLLAADDPALDDLVWVAGKPGGVCAVPRGPGIVSMPREGWKCHLDQLSVGPGSSGAAIVGDKGIIGMVLGDSVTHAECLLIKRVEDMVVKDAGEPWNLTGYRPTSQRVGLKIPMTNRQLAWRTLAAGLATGAAVVWQRSADREVQGALDQYRAASTAEEALALREDVARAQGRRDSANVLVVATSVATGAALIWDLLRGPPTRSKDQTGSKWEWTLGVGEGIEAGSVGLTIGVRFGRRHRGVPDDP